MVGQRVPRAWPAPQASLVRVPSTVTEESHAHIQWFTFSGCVSICQWNRMRHIAPHQSLGLSPKPVWPVSTLPQPRSWFVFGWLQVSWLRSRKLAVQWPSERDESDVGSWGDVSAKNMSLSQIPDRTWKRSNKTLGVSLVLLVPGHLPGTLLRL